MSETTNRKTHIRLTTHPGSGNKLRMGTLQRLAHSFALVKHHKAVFAPVEHPQATHLLLVLPLGVQLVVLHVLRLYLISQLLRHSLHTRTHTTHELGEEEGEAWETQQSPPVAHQQE